MSHPAILALIDALRSHPDFDGGLETSDMPLDAVMEVYEALGVHGDDLNEMLKGARGWSDEDGKHKLVVLPRGNREDSSWVVKYVTDPDVDIDWRHPTPDALGALIRKIVGGNSARQKAFRDLLEEIWQKNREEIEAENAGVEGEWKTIPNRDDDEIIARALQRFVV